MAEPDLKWVSEPFWRDKLQQACQEYEQNPQIHLLYRYEHLIDEASISMGVVQPTELSSRLGKDQAPTFDEMW